MILMMAVMLAVLVAMPGHHMGTGGVHGEQAEAVQQPVASDPPRQ